jgi:putative PEP-CTERM system TPR-repeat lipoprotein
MKGRKRVVMQVRAPLLALLLATGLVACGAAPPPGMLLARAQASYLKGDDKAAIIDVKTALQQDGKLVAARELLARLHNRAFEGAAAEKEIDKAIELGLDRQQALPILARALMLQGKFRPLLDSTNGATGADVLSMRGAAHAALRESAEAGQAYRLALQAEPSQIAALSGLGQLAMRAGDAEAALRYSAQLLAAHPEAADAWMFKADLAYALRQPEAALAAYSEVLAREPGRVSAHVVKGYLLVAKGDLKGAGVEMKAANQAAPGSLVALYGQAMLDYNAGRHKVALEQLQTILSRAPEYMPAVLLSGAVQLALGSLPQAEKALLRYLENSPDNRYARELLASCLLSQGRPQEALSQLQPLLTAAAGVPLLTLAGKAYMASANFSAASAMFQRASHGDPASAALRIALGMSRLAQGQDEQALADISAAAGLEQSGNTARLALVSTALQLKHYDKAEAGLGVLERETPSDPGLALLRGDLAAATGKPAAARLAYEHALTLRPGYFLALVALVRMDVAQGSFVPAEQRLQATAKAQPDNVAVLTLLADLARQRGQGAAALAWMRQAAAVTPATLAPALGLARELLVNSGADEALTLMRKLQVLHAGQPEVLDLLGQAQQAANDLPGALESYGKLVVLAPRNPQSYTRLALAYARMVRPDAAELNLKKAVALDPSYLPAQMALSMLYMRQGQRPRALVVARQLQAQPANAAAGHSMEGDLLSAVDGTGALAAYQRAFALQPTSALMIRQHILLSQNGQVQLAAARMAAWQRRHPADAEAASYMGEASIHAGQYDAAIAQLLIALARRPLDVSLLNNLAFAYHQAKNPLALATAEKANQLDPRSVPAIDTLAWILVGQGQHARALPLLQQAVMLAPAAPAYRYHLAAALVLAGDRAGARRELDQLINSGQQFEELGAVLALRKRLDSRPGEA